MADLSVITLAKEVVELGERGDSMTDADVDALMERIPKLFRRLCVDAGLPKKQVTAVVTKFRDSGRRSPPTAVFSSVGPGRPQNADDGNRANRWALPSDHKYYAPMREAKLVEIKYFLQSLCFVDAPEVPNPDARDAFAWLLGHELTPGAYLDPIMLRAMNFKAFLNFPRLATSGHLVPLARGGRHEPSNTFLMLDRSNTLQNDLTFDEFFALVDDVLTRQAEIGVFPDPNELPSNEFLEGAISRAE
jgi:hypothetical protein